MNLILTTPVLPLAASQARPTSGGHHLETRRHHEAATPFNARLMNDNAHRALLSVGTLFRKCGSLYGGKRAPADCRARTR